MTDTPPDPAAFLAGVRMQAEDHRLVPAHMVLPLLAAVEAVLELHQSVDRGAGVQCKGCATHVTFTRWPCPTYLAVTTALTGKESSDEH